MRTPVVSVAPDTRVIDSVRLLLETNRRGLPVIDKAGELVGDFREGSKTPVRRGPRYFRGRDASYLAPPAQIRTGPIRAYGSHLGCLTAKRLSGHG